MSKTLTSASKLMSLVLRHQPEKLGLSLDKQGWVSIAELANASAGQLTQDLIREVATTSSKQRFAISNDGHFVRANQGHSIDVDLGLVPIIPPAVLFHGTANSNLASIKESGLKPGSRQHVHLSQDKTTAISVGSRHGKPVVLKVAAGEMHQTGFIFYQSDNSVWLTTSVPWAFLSLDGNPTTRGG